MVGEGRLRARSVQPAAEAPSRRRRRRGCRRRALHRGDARPRKAGVEIGSILARGGFPLAGRRKMMSEVEAMLEGKHTVEEDEHDKKAATREHTAAGVSKARARWRALADTPFEPLGRSTYREPLGHQDRLSHEPFAFKRNSDLCRNSLLATYARRLAGRTADLHLEPRNSRPHTCIAVASVSCCKTLLQGMSSSFGSPQSGKPLNFRLHQTHWPTRP